MQTFNLSAQGLTKYGEITSSGSNFIDKNGKIGSSPALGKYGQVFATLTTTAASAITSITATSGGNVTSDGGTAVTAHGVCWSTSTSPTTALSTKTSDGTGTGVFTSSITGLTLGNTYYVRAYATNSAGTAYGNEVSFSTGIGASYQGGIIAYILQSGDPGYIAGQTHGLIAAASDQSTATAWSNVTSTLIGTTGTAIGTGNANSNAIMGQSGASSGAAFICHSYSGGGYSDWYLPSKDELYKLYLNQTAVGGFDASYYYWSSTEANSTSAWFQDFYYGGRSNNGKANSNSMCVVRAIRAF